MDKNTTENRPRKLISITAGVITGLCNGLLEPEEAWLLC